MNNINSFESVDFYQLDELYSDEQKLVRDSVRQFVNQEIIPNIEDITFPATFVPCENLATLSAIKARITVSTLYMPTAI